MHRKLRVNIKSLAAESRIIRHQISKAGPCRVKNELRYHLVHVVRPESRAAQLLYAYVRGIPYKSVERKTYSDKFVMSDIESRIRSKAKRHRIEVNNLDQWFKD